MPQQASIEIFSHAQSVVMLSTAKELEHMLDWRNPYNEYKKSLECVEANLEYPIM
jgi:hypothetical protein